MQVFFFFAIHDQYFAQRYKKQTIQAGAFDNAITPS
jgi:hypothetical protein